MNIDSNTLDFDSDYLRSKAILNLKKAKELEQKQLEKGYEYVKIDKSTRKLKKK